MPKVWYYPVLTRASVSGFHSLFYNPAGLQSIGHYALTVSTLNCYLDLQLSQFYYGVKLTDESAIAIQGKFLDLGEFEVTSVNNPEGTGNFLNPHYAIVGLSYSGRLWSSILYGENINYYTE